MRRPPTARETAIFMAGYRYGAERMIAAHDPLLDLIARTSVMLARLARDFPAGLDLELLEDLGEVAGMLDRRVVATMEDVRGQRFERGGGSALRMFEFERLLG